jgi:hypothetical protein
LVIKHYLIEEGKDGEENEGQDNSEVDNKKPPVLVVECYDPSTS